MVETKMVLATGESGRPFGVAVIAVVVIVFGVVAAVLGLLGMLTGFVTGLMDPSRGAGLTFLAGVAGVVLGGLYVIAGAGLWSLRPWAWWLAALAGVVGFVLALGSPVWMLIWAGLVAYLFVVRSNFGVLPGVPHVIRA